MSQRDEDLALLRRLLAWIETADEGETRASHGEVSWEEPFARMLDDLESGKWPELTKKQRAWVKGVAEKVFDEPEYLNLFSAGKVPRGFREVPDPPALAHRPLKPPGRR